MEQHRVLKDQISVIFNPFYQDEIVARADHPEVPTLLGQLLLKDNVLRVEISPVAEWSLAFVSEQYNWFLFFPFRFVVI